MTARTPPAIAERKRRLRERLGSERGAMPPEVRAADSVRIAGRLIDRQEVRAARIVSVFSSFGSEVDTTSIIRELHERGARIVVPFVERRVMGMAAYSPGDRLVATAFGPVEPAHRVLADPASIDVIVVPGLAFDRRGHRLGYGGGHYDRFLASLPARTVRIGVCFTGQILDAVPHGPGDERVDLIIAPDEVIRVPARAGGT